MIKVWAGSLNQNNPTLFTDSEKRVKGEEQLGFQNFSPGVCMMEIDSEEGKPPPPPTCRVL
jgi:hypothetical protein